MTEPTTAEDLKALDRLHAGYHQNARNKGFVENHEKLQRLAMIVAEGGTVEADPELAEYLLLTEAGNELMLLVGELGEAHEQLRTSPFAIEQTYYIDENGEPTLERFAADGTMRKPEGYPSEIADVEIRLGDTVGRRRFQLSQITGEKAEYNATRARKHGKKL